MIDLLRAWWRLKRTPPKSKTDIALNQPNMDAQLDFDHALYNFLDRWEWLWRWAIPRKCPDCGRRWRKCPPDSGCLPF